MKTGKRFRIDWTVEKITPIGEDKDAKYYKIRMVPDKRTWEHREVDGTKGWFNTLENIFISDDEMAQAAKTMKGIPITVSRAEIGNPQEYIEKSRKRVRTKNGE